jgi:hypothetical protein
VESDPNPDPNGLAEEGGVVRDSGIDQAAGEEAARTTETEGAETEGEDSRDPLRFSNWMKRSATGAVMTGIAFGLKEALQPKRAEVAFVIEAPGEPEDPDKPIDLRFDPESPADTVAIIRRPGGEEPSSPPAPSA